MLLVEGNKAKTSVCLGAKAERKASDYKKRKISEPGCLGSDQ